MFAAGVALVFGLAMDRRVTSRDLKSEGSCNCTDLTRGLFEISGRFGPVSVDFGHFWASFFLFSLFFNFDARVSNASKSRMMYCPSEKGFKAGQLGPRGYRIFYFCPACGFGIEPVVSLGLIVCESAAAPS
jgi:hypothetical protein